MTGYARAGRSWWLVKGLTHEGCGACAVNVPGAARLGTVTGSHTAAQRDEHRDPATGTISGHGATVARVVALAVTDPDDPDQVDPPLWEGTPADAADVLRPGEYRAYATVKTLTAPQPCRVTVHPSGQVHLAGGLS